MEIIGKGVVYRAETPSNTQSAAFPGICVLPNGRWICSFRAAPAKTPLTGQHIVVMMSDDNGNTWSKPATPFDPPAIEGKPGSFRTAYVTALGGTRCIAALCWVDISDPSLPYFNPETEGLLDTKIMISRSEDGGSSWTRPELVDTSPFHVPVPLTGPLLLLGDRRLACQFELNKPYRETAVWRHSSVLLFSGDEGNSWTEHVITSNDPTNRLFYWDQRPGVVKEGNLLNLFWTYDAAAATYLNIHARQSDDFGRTWSDYRDIGVPGQPAQPVRLGDGRIAMVYVDRTAQPAIMLRLSADGGLTWPVESELPVARPVPDSQTAAKSSMQDTWAEMSRFSIGLPATALTPDGRLLVVYYAGARTDETAIEWALLQSR